MKPGSVNAIAVADFFFGGILALIGASVLVAMSNAAPSDRAGSFALAVPLILIGLFVACCDVIARRTKLEYLRKTGRICGYSLLALLEVAALFIPTMH